MAGYSVVSMGVPIQYCDRVAVFYRVLPCFYIKALQQFVPNVVRFQMVKGERQYYIFGCYLSPNDALNIDCVLAAVGKRPRWSELLVAGNFKYDPTSPEGADRDEKNSADP